MKHTPGPWKNDCPEIWSDKIKIAVVSKIGPRMNVDELKYNAALIAAAPEMIAVIEKLEKALEGNILNESDRKLQEGVDQYIQGLIDSCRQVLKKAKEEI